MLSVCVTSVSLLLGKNHLFAVVKCSVVDLLCLRVGMASVARVSTRLGGALYWGPTSVTVSRGNTPRSYYTYSPEPAQPLKRDPKWVSAKEAVQCIKSGMGMIYITVVIKLTYSIENWMARVEDERRTGASDVGLSTALHLLPWLVYKVLRRLFVLFTLSFMTNYAAVGVTSHFASLLRSSLQVLHNRCRNRGDISDSESRVG